MSVVVEAWYPTVLDAKRIAQQLSLELPQPMVVCLDTGRFYVSSVRQANRKGYVPFYTFVKGELLEKSNLTDR